jgi:hypothetical protein
MKLRHLFFACSGVFVMMFSLLLLVVIVFSDEEDGGKRRKPYLWGRERITGSPRP